MSLSRRPFPHLPSVSVLILAITFLGFAPAAPAQTTSAEFFTRAGAGLFGIEHGATAIADLDGDGHPDVLLSGRDADGRAVAFVYVGDGQGGFTQTQSGLTGVVDGSASVADLNADGHLDVVMTGETDEGASAAVYLGDGDGEFNVANAGLTGVASSSLAIGDLDQDGTLDLVVTGRDGSGPSTTVYLGNGDGDFQAAIAELTDFEHGSTSIAELDGDGTLDVLLTGMTGTGQRASEVYLGNGDGSFNKIDAGLPGVDQSSAAIADLNEDGVLDVVLTGRNNTGAPVTFVGLGSGDGGFTETDAGLTGVLHGAASVADVNEDGHLDVVLSGQSENAAQRATLYLGDGTGRFRSADAGLTAVQRSASFVADLDADEDVDLLLTGRDSLFGVSARVYVNRTERPSANAAPRWNRSPSSAVVAAGTSLSASQGTVWIEAGDPDGDRLQVDLAAAVPNASVVDVGNGVARVTFTPDRGQLGQTVTLSLVATDSDGSSTTTSFQVDVPAALAAFDTDLVGVQLGASAVADLNGDGHPDVVVTGTDETGDRSARVYLGDGAGRFQEADAGLTGVMAGSVSIADLNGDGHRDLLITGFASGSPSYRATVYLSDGNGGFQATAAGLTGMAFGSSAVGDVNGDGHPDVVLTGRDASHDRRAMLFLGQGDGSFQEADVGFTGVTSGSASLADLNADGALDVVIAGNAEGDQPTATVYLGDGTGGFSPADAGLAGVWGSSVSIADLDADGILDLVVTGEGADGARTATVYLGDGDGGFQAVDAGLVGTWNGASAVADLDRDGHLDLVLTGSDERGLLTATMYLGDGTAGFRAVDVGLVGGTGGSVSVADLNGDGAPDLLLTGATRTESQTAIAYENLGGAPLPVVLARFAGMQDGETVRLEWITASETNNAGFYVQRKSEREKGRKGAWTRIGFVEGAGMTSDPEGVRDYRFTDTELPYAAQTLSYRLVQVDTDGTEHLSDVVAVEVGLSDAFRLSAVVPNPVEQSGTLYLAVQKAQPVRATLYNVLGQRVATLYDGRVEPETPPRLTVDGRRLSSGTYFVRIVGEHFRATRRVAVVR